MNTIKIEKNITKMVAHRGVSGIELENTNAAFIAAGNRSYYGVETDVRKTADGQFVILHDDNTERVGIDCLYPEKSTYKTLRALQLKDRNGNMTRTDMRIPSLEEYIETCKRYDKHCVLELKGGYDTETLAEMITRIRNIGWLDNVTFISFSLDNLIKVRALLPKQRIQWLTCEFNDNVFGAMKQYNLSLDIYFGGLHEQDVKVMHDAGFEVNCWTVDKKEDAERLVSWGVDYITSNILE
ncbi:MAG: glycerophosphodiester phosphodiesterase family protein [Eubacteriales bacterium]|nr:glycerophosphodiester phosphodiesterase family protein [Eubacteriales bacterium]